MLNTAQELIFERYKHPRFAGELADVTHLADGANPLCGDEIHIDILVKEGVITDLRHKTRACAICTAAADLLAETLIGKAANTVTTTEEMTEMVGIPLSAIRLKCALLPLETVNLALAKD